MSVGRRSLIQENPDQGAQGVGELAVEASELVDGHERARLERSGERGLNARRCMRAGCREGVTGVSPQDEAGILLEGAQGGAHLLRAAIELSEARGEAAGAFAFASSPDASDRVPKLLELALGAFEYGRFVGGAQRRDAALEHGEVVGTKAPRRAQGALQGEARALDRVQGEVLESVAVAAQPIPELALGGDHTAMDGHAARARAGAARWR